MNDRTRKDLLRFITAVETLTSGVLIHIGMETATEVINACEDAKRSLESDETILEV